MRETLTAERAREVLRYDPETGELRWRVSLCGRAMAGEVAGSVTSKGYRGVWVDGWRYPASWLAWLITTGEWPADQIDHRNNVKDDNRWVNLRPATNAQNSANRGRRSDNASGVKGVSWHARQQRWIAHIRVDGKGRHLGSFRSKEDAGAAYAHAAAVLHGEFARVA